jgi:hypothetical protein
MFICFSLELFGLDEAIPAVYRLIVVRLKGDLCLFAALSAGGGEHLAGTSIAVAAAIPKHLGPSCRTARGTTFRLIGEAFGSEELLLFSRKGERFSAFGTLKGFLGVSHC